MPWYRVEVQNSGMFATSAFATDFIRQVAKAYRAAGIPPGARVYHTESSTGDHVYFLSPAASSVAAEAIRAFSGRPCSIEPDVAGLRPISL